MFPRFSSPCLLPGAVAIVAVIGTVSPVFAQAKVPTFKATRPPFAALPLSHWVGEKVVFRPALPADRDDAYLAWSTAPADGIAEEIFLSQDAAYADLAGKTATIKFIGSADTNQGFNLADVSGASLPVDPNETNPAEDTEDADTVDKNAFWITVELDDTGRRYRSQLDDGALTDIVFLRDVEAARKTYSGKTLWTVGGYMTTEETAGKPEGERYISLGNFEKVTVVDAAPGLMTEAPVQIVFKRSGGQVGYVPVHVSRTNTASEGTIYDVDTFEGCFVDYNPQIRYPFTPALWKNILNRRVTPGMTPLQVVMTYLPPDVVKKPANPAQGDMVYVYNWDLDGVIGTRRIFFRKNRVIADKTEEKPKVVKKIARPRR